MSARDWYRDAVIYELHVRAFADSDGDGKGDFRGLLGKLDYLADLGVTALWLLPFYPSPLRDDGYDIADYRDVHPAYGTLDDVKLVIAEAHRRGLRVITELVANHTSDQHPWFQRARHAPPGSSERDYYVWSDTPDRYAEARIIFKDFEASNWSLDPVANAYYWHRFYAHQPDLNFDNPAVRAEITAALDFWLDLGVDGVRLDAIPYLYEREGTSCENLPETHHFLKTLRAHLDAAYPDRMLLAEANQWPEDAVAYFGDGDECHMAFHFPLMPRLFMSLRMEDRFPIIDILAQTPAIPDGAQWAVFLRNHDELTLEMVTDEERDYMYRAYTTDPEARINLGIRRRLAPLLGNDRRRIELMNALLFALPGTPVIYYGDEIGMGDNIYLGDRNGVRTPMQWSADRNAGFSNASRQRLYLPVIAESEYHYETVNVEAQHANPHSLLAWTKRLIALRKRFRAFGRGTLRFLHPENRTVLAFLREHEGETILVVANLSRFAQYVELDLREWNGAVPTELFGTTPFPRIGDLPYLLTLGPHGFLWFRLDAATATAHGSGEPPLLTGADPFAPDGGLARALPGYLAGRRWFLAKGRRIRDLRIVHQLPLSDDPRAPRLCLVEVSFSDGDPDHYVLFLAHDRPDEVERALAADAVIARTADGGAVSEALADPRTGDRLLAAITAGAVREVGGLRLVATREAGLDRLRGTSPAGLEASLGRSEQSNSSVLFGERLILKVFRRVEEGPNPDLEIGRHLAAHGFSATAPLAGALELVAGSARYTIAVLHGYVPNHGTAWDRARAELATYSSSVAGDGAADAGVTSRAWAARLGTRVAELHASLAIGGGSAFEPERLTLADQRSVYQSTRTALTETCTALRRALSRLSPAIAALAEEAAGAEERLRGHLAPLLARPLDGKRTRIHGDLHLGQILDTGDDIAIIDFEGEPSRTLGARRLKRSPLVDVAGMLRSFSYAASTASLERAEDGPAPDAAPAARHWEAEVSAAFLDAYLARAAPDGLVPRDPDDRAVLLRALLLGRCVYEVRYELAARPEWTAVPLHGLLALR
ncbi:MAG TPA: maltose alpha-D-glucosyltransferase [Candidatus Limnocylindria bacterium]